MFKTVIGFQSNKQGSNHLSNRLLTVHYLEFLSLKGCCTGSPESTHVMEITCRCSLTTSAVTFRTSSKHLGLTKYFQVKNTCADPEGVGGGQGVLVLKIHRHIGLLSNTGPDSLKITKLPCQHSMLGHHRLKWRFRWLAAYYDGLNGSLFHFSDNSQFRILNSEF